MGGKGGGGGGSLLRNRCARGGRGGLLVALFGGNVNLFFGALFFQGRVLGEGGIMVGGFYDTTDTEKGVKGGRDGREGSRLL